MKRIIAKSLVATVALVTTAGLSAANAATYSWNAARTGGWSTGSNWIGNTAPSNAGGDDLIFGSGTGSSSRTATNDIAGNYPVSSISFSGTTSYTLTGSSLLLNGNVANNTNRIQTISNNITTGSSPVAMSSGTGGSSLLSLSGAVTNPGGINLTSGRISFTQAIVGGGNITTDPTAQVFLQANSQGGIGDLNSGGRLTIGNNNGTGVMVLDTTNATFFSTSTTVLNVGTDLGGVIISGTTADQIVSTGAVNFNGDLTMDFGQMAIDPNSLESFNTAWKLFDAATYGGNFTAMNVTGATGVYGNLNGSWTLEDGVWVSPTINNDAGNQYFAFDQASGNLVVVPEPSTIVFAALGATISGVHCVNKRRRARQAISA